MGVLRWQWYQLGHVDQIFHFLLIFLLSTAGKSRNRNAYEVTPMTVKVAIAQPFRRDVSLCDSKRDEENNTELSEANCWFLCDAA